jgi:hypothetical protein
MEMGGPKAGTGFVSPSRLVPRAWGGKWYQGSGPQNSNGSRMMYYLEGVTRGSFGVEQGELFHFGDLGTWDRANIGGVHVASCGKEDGLRRSQGLWMRGRGVVIASDLGT